MLLFPYGTDGFHLDIQTDVMAKSVTAMEYYCWQLAARRPGLNVVLCGDRLFHAAVYADQRCRRPCENGTAAAKIFVGQSEQCPQLTLFWLMTEIATVFVWAIFCIIYSL